MGIAKTVLASPSRDCVWRCLLCRCAWANVAEDWEESPVKDDDTVNLRRHGITMVGAGHTVSARDLKKAQATPHASGLEASTLGRSKEEHSSEDEGFVSAVESDDGEFGSHASPPAPPVQHVRMHQCTRPRLPEDAQEEQVAEYEELNMPSVTGDRIDEVCRLSSSDPQDLKCRLTARRFAIANGGNVRAAVKQMLAHKTWLAKTREEMLNQYEDDPLLVKWGYDKLGHPLYFYDGIRLNAIHRNTEDLVLQVATILQRAIDILESGDDLLDRGFRPSWRLQKITLILFLPKGSEPDFRKLGPVLRLLQNQFPERLYRALIFPIGKWTPFFWKLAKPFLDARTTQKIKLMNGGNRPQELLEYVAPEYVPKEFGGTLQN